MDKLKKLSKKLDKNVKWFYDDVYGITIYVKEIKTDKAQIKFLKEISKFLGNIDLEPSSGKMITIGENYLYITKDIKDIRTLSHELIHIVFDLFSHRGIPITLENDEIFAYYYSYLFQNILNLIIK